MRLQILEPRNHTWLKTGDRCWNYGEYTSEGGYLASDTNQLILNLKKKPTVSPAQLRYKTAAIDHWGSVLAKAINVPGTVGVLTFVPMPGSKPVGHAEYDDRMLRVLQRMAVGVPGVDVRPLLKQVGERSAQHEGTRLTPTQLCTTLAVDYSLMPPPVARTIVVVDDVITMGASFAAAKSMLAGLPNVQEVVGFFLAKTVRPAPSFTALTPAQLQQLLGPSAAP